MSLTGKFNNTGRNGSENLIIAIAPLEPPNNCHIYIVVSSVCLDSHACIYAFFRLMIKEYFKIFHIYHIGGRVVAFLA